MKKAFVYFILLFFSYTGYCQSSEDEKPFSIIISGLGGFGFINYNFDNNVAYPTYYQSGKTAALLTDIPLKATVLFHHHALHIGGGLDRRDINFGAGIKRQSTRGRYFDDVDFEYKDINSSLFKIYGRGELIIIQHVRREKIGGFGGFIEGGALTVNNPVGTASSGGFCLGIGGFYFGQISTNFFITVELAGGYDQYKSNFNYGPSTHNLYSTELMLGLRVRI